MKTLRRLTWTCRSLSRRVARPGTLDTVAVIQYQDGSRVVEVEDLDQVQFPKMRFSKAVHIAIFAYGQRRVAPEPQPSINEDRPIVPGLSTDVSFPDVKDVDPHIRRSVARLH